MKYQIILGDNRETLKTIADNSVDAIVTDPPYGIDFLGKDWDVNTGELETYQECLRVLKPGGHILAFSAPRTYHHLAMTLERAGFEIRDQIMWIYSSGFPKSQDVGKSIDRQSGKAAHKADLAEVKAILKQLYKESGKTVGQIDRECGFNAGGYLKTDFKDKGWANNLPRDEKWQKLKAVLGCSDDYDDYFVTTPQVKVGEKLSGCFSDEQRYTIGASGASTVDITKSQTEAGRQWSGWGTALKPAHEPIALARKPIKLSIAKNCQEWGVGALNIDATRVPYDDPAEAEADARWRAKWSNHNVAGPVFQDQDITEVRKRQNKPSGGGNNAATFKNFSAEERTTKDKPTAGRRTASFHNATGGGETQSGGDGSGGWEASSIGRFPSNVIGEIPEYQKYFYCPKVNRAERHVGFDEQNSVKTMMEHLNAYYVDSQNQPFVPQNNDPYMIYIPGKGKVYPHGLKHEYSEWCKNNNVDPGNVGNNHPTVKPVELMKYLIKLVTPPGGTVLDPYNGSGSTGMAAVELGHPYIGLELDPHYVAIARTRIEAWNKPKPDNTTFDQLFEQ